MECIASLQTIVEKVKGAKNKTIVVAAAEAHDVLASTVHAKREGLADVLYIGKTDQIRKLATAYQIPIEGIDIIEESDALKAAKLALQFVKEGQAQVLMKGQIGTSQILEIVLKDEDLKKEGGKEHFLSHVTIFEWEGRLKMFSDPALSIAPTIEQKRKITLNVLESARKLGMTRPRIAFLSAVEKVNPKMPSSVDAAELAKMDWGDAIAGGPLAFDGAMFEEAYQAKGVPSPVEGKADILITPNIETANLLYKVLAWMARVPIGGTMVGSPIPFVVTSRSDSERIKFVSIAITLYLAE